MVSIIGIPLVYVAIVAPIGLFACKENYYQFHNNGQLLVQVIPYTVI